MQRTPSSPQVHPLVGVTLCLACVLALLAGCGGGDGDVSGLPDSLSIAVQVRNAAGFPVPGATVYLVPAGDVDTRPFDGADVRSGAADDFDEPLEDAVRLRGNNYPQAQTDASGAATVSGVSEAQYFCFVAPGPGDAEHLPGGSGCRQAFSAIALSQDTRVVVMSSQPPPVSFYLGSSVCLQCHSEYADVHTHAHRLAFAVPGNLGPKQDASRYPDFEKGWQRFTPALSHTGGTAIWCYNRDPSRGADRFETLLTDPTLSVPGAVNYVKAWLWEAPGGVFKITLENIHSSAGTPGVMDPPNLWTLDVDLTYGGALSKQTPLVRVPNRNGRYPLFQFQPEGSDTRFDRTRRVYRDYQLDRFWDDTQKIFRYPDTSTAFEGNCTACHSTGFERYQDGVTGEWLSRAAKDNAGVIDIDGDGDLDEMNIGCEVCHGPGTAHGVWAADILNEGREARYIVSPQYLSPSRTMMLCGRCHDRVQGRGSVPNDEPLNTANQMARPGISRAEFLAEYVAPSQRGPAATDLWTDELHSRHQHQQYSDLLKSPKHRNGRLLVGCNDCHENHGRGPYRGQLRWDPDDPHAGLCFQCHGQELIPHMIAKTGETHAGNATRCMDCHMPETAQSGAGRLGLIANPPLTGTVLDVTKTYYENDLRSHLFGAYAGKTHPDVAGVLPAAAMPIPYTNSCAAGCHVVDPLQFLKLTPWPEELRALHTGVPGVEAPVPSDREER